MTSGLLKLWRSVLFGSLVLISTLTGAAQYTIAVVAEGLDHPWSLAFLPNGEMLVTERSGKLRMIRNRKLLDYEVEGVPTAFVKGQGGLFDVLVDPDFGSNERIYISYAAGKGSANALEVVSGRLDGSKLLDVKKILQVTPSKNTPHHYGGRMAFAADGTLLVSTGDGFDYREQAQSLSSLLGKILRINLDGSIPSDNPFVGDPNSRDEILSYGHRNPQGIAVTQDGLIWMHEHGPQGGDELNLVEAGINYGWPAVTFGIDYSGAYVSPFTEAEGMRAPATYWVPSIAPGGLAVYESDVFPEWRGNLFVATLKEKSVRRLVLNGSKVIKDEIMFTELDERIRDVRTGPDGNLYLLADSNPGAIYRIAPKQ